MSPPWSSRLIDSWDFLDAPSEFKRALWSSLTNVDEDELVPEGRYEWFLCATSKGIKLRGNNRVQVLDVLRGRQMVGGDGELTEASKKMRSCVFICRFLVHGCGVIHLHDVSPMEEYDIGFCPLLPRVIRLRLDIAWSRFTTSSKVVPKMEVPPPFLHNLGAVDIEGINEKASLETGSVNLAESSARDNSNMVDEVVNGRNKAITVASIKCSNQIPRVVMMATRAAMMAVDTGCPVATVAEMNPCSSCNEELLIGDEINRRMESLKDGGDSSSEDEIAGV